MAEVHEGLITDPFAKAFQGGMTQSPLAQRLAAQTRSPAKVVAQRLYQGLENASTQKQTLLEQQQERLRQKSDKIREIQQRKTEELHEQAARKAQEVEAKLHEAELRRKAEETARLEKIKDKHLRIEENLNQKKTGTDVTPQKEAIRSKLAAAEERQRTITEDNKAKAQGFNERVTTAQRRKWEFDAASQDTAQKLAERIAEAEGRREAEETARLEKVSKFNQRVEEAKAKRETNSPPHTPTVKCKASVESIKSDIDTAIANKQVRAHRGHRCATAPAAPPSPAPNGRGELRGGVPAAGAAGRLQPEIFFPAASEGAQGGSLPPPPRGAGSGPCPAGASRAHGPPRRHAAGPPPTPDP